MATYSEFINNPVSQKNVLFEINKGLTLGDQLWEKHWPNVWKTTYSWESGKNVETTAWGVGTWGAGNWGLASATELPQSPNTAIITLGSVFVNNDIYTLTNSLDDLYESPNSFYWDQTTQVVYIYFDGYIRDADITLGVLYGYANRSLYFNNIYYDGRIQSIPDISVKRDNLFNNIVRFEGGSVVLINKDGAFDNFGDDDIYGQRITIKIGGDDLPYNKYQSIYSGYLDKYDYDDEIITITVKDERKNLQKSIPTNLYDDTTYPQIKGSSVGKPIAIGYGTILQAPAVCLNETNKVASTYNFKFVDTTEHDIESIEQVYVDGVEVAHTAGSLTLGTFDLASSIYKPGQKVAISFHGYTDGVSLIENPLDVIEDLLLIYNSTPYNASFYNIDNWDLQKIGLDNIGLFVGKSEPLIKIIGEITSSILGSFIVNGEGLFDIKTVDTGRESKITIEKSHMIGERVRTTQNTDEYISSSRVGYAKLYDEKDYAYYIDKSDEEKLSRKYRSYKESEFKTLLTNRFDAVNYSSTTLDLFGGVIPEYTFTTKMQTAGLEIEDIITIDISRLNNPSEYIRAEVLSKSINYIESTVTIQCRWAGIRLPVGDLVVEHSTDPDYIFKFSLDSYIILENGE